jgi:uncharacterized RDD family membrane protein YckC
MASNWYYVDASGAQVGPMEAAQLRAALREGKATPASLAWRDGLSGWLPISQLLNEIDPPGVMPSPATVPLPPAPVAATGEANPYRAPQFEGGGEAWFDSQDIVYAGFWRRWAALFLDQLIIGIPLSVVFFFVSLAVGLAGGGQPDPAKVVMLQLGLYAVWFVVAAFYFAGLESSEAQATFGKRALGIKVTDLNGQRLSFKHALGRWAGAAISYMTMYIGFAMAGFTQRKQALHDYLASTLVVDRWAYTRFPERQQRGLSGCLVLFIVMIVGMLVLIPILVAVAIAQYSEYVRRANGGAYVEPEGITVCETPASSPYVARCLPPSFEA